ncbi:hypothetical protein LCGC14_0451220 [marine sediment metagenome]|uniref:Uncharacterized protein n=1 Tax=marine sediment metagenome TaxID=412755 RepID=A0A0F9V4N1_9ZZZZ
MALKGEDGSASGQLERFIEYHDNYLLVEDAKNLRNIIFVARCEGQQETKRLTDAVEAVLNLKIDQVTHNYHEWHELRQAVKTGG